MKALVPVASLLSLCCLTTLATDYYVDSAGGNDQSAGTSAGAAWKSLDKVNQADLKPGDRVLFRKGCVWRGSLKVKSGAQDRPVVYTSYGEAGNPPALRQSVSLSNPEDWLPGGRNLWQSRPDPSDSPGLDADVGNLVLTDKEGGLSAAWKRWNVAELKRQGDFYSDPLSPDAGPRTVHMYSERNPAEHYRSIEAALRHNIIDAGGQSWFIVDGIECSHTAAHGLAGKGIRNAVIRNCRFVWIGGGHLFTKGPLPTRYGNGIEFWCACEDNLVENCFFAHIYDTAMTNQGPDACTVRNMVWRKNRIEFCEQAYEIWLSSKDSAVEGLIYEDNESYDCGFGWAHEQRPDKTATHLLAYSLASTKLDITYRNNIFCRTQGAFIWYFNERLPEITACDGNRYRQVGENVGLMPLIRRGGQAAAGLTFEQFQEKTGFDKNSRLETAP